MLNIVWTDYCNYSNVHSTI